MKKNSIYVLKPALFYKFLNTFDFIDNNFLSFQYYQFSSLNLNNVFIRVQIDSSSKINLLIVSTTLETLAQQRPFIQTLSKSSNFITTLRNRKLLSFLDFCLLSLFLNKIPQQLMFTPDKIGQNFYIFSPPKFSEKLDSHSTPQYSIQVLNYLNQDRKLNLLPTI